MRKPTFSLVAGTLSHLVATPLLLAGLAGTSLSALAQTGTPVGKIITVRGHVEARDTNGIVRALTRSSTVFEADTISVGADAYAQIRMADSAMLALQANTELAFNTYEFDGNPATPDTAIMSMVRGGFRTISGTIGDEDADDYRIDTPYASIGIRGTVHSAVIVNGVLFTGVYEGGTTISNNAGSIDAGIGADYDFTETHAGAAPLGLVEAPPMLAQISIAPIASQDEPGDAAVETAAATPTPAANAGADPAPADTETSVNAAVVAATQEPAPNFAALGIGNATASNGSQPGVVTVSAIPNAAADLTDTLVTAGSGTTAASSSATDDVNPSLFSRTTTELATNNTRSDHSSGSSSNDGGGNSSGINDRDSATVDTRANSDSSATTATTTTDRGNASTNNGSSSTGTANTGTTTDRGNSTTTDRDNSATTTTGRGSSTGDTTGTSSTTTTTSSDRGNSGSSDGNSSTVDRGSSGNGDGNTTDRGNSSTDAGSGNSSTTDRGSTGNSGSSNGDGSSSNTTADRGSVASGNGNSDSSTSATDTGTSTDRGNSGNQNSSGRNARQIAASRSAETLALPDLDPRALLQDWGVWDSSLLVVLENQRALMPGALPNERDKAGIRQARIAHLAGTVTYQNAQFAGVDATGAALLDVDMTFDVDLRGGPGAISNGRLLVIDGSHEVWRAAFQGDVSSTSAIMGNVTGASGIGAPLSGSVHGVFTGTGTVPDFLAGFILESGDSFVKGLTVLNPTCSSCQ